MAVGLEEVALRQITIALCVLLCACASAPQSVAQPAEQPTPISAGERYVVPSSVYGDEREINVWTPPGYAEGDQRYTVVYVLDGGLDQDFPHIAGLGQLGALSWTYQQLIIVGVRTNQRRHELTPPITREPRLAQELPEAGGAPEFRRYLERDVIPFIESNYRTGERRALMGESLAGLFVVDTFLTQLALFHDYIAVSPSLWWDNKALALEASQRLASRRASDTRLYLTIANEGAATQTGMDALLAALQAAPAGSATWRYVDRSATETHATIYHGAALDAFRWLYALPEGDYGPTPWYYLDEADRPPPA
jgi:uncharacterized protein